MPWNFPFWQVFRFAAPALMAGNAAHPQARLQRAALRARDRGGLPPRRLPGGAVPHRCWSAPPRSSGLIADPRVVAVTLTGSERAGRRWRQQAGRELKKTVLELGGSDPFVVLADADVDAAAHAAADGAR